MFFGLIVNHTQVKLHQMTTTTTRKNNKILRLKSNFTSNGTITFLFRDVLLHGSCESSTHMIKVSTPTLQMSAGGPTTSPFNISGAASRRKENCERCIYKRTDFTQKLSWYQTHSLMFIACISRQCRMVFISPGNCF